MSVSNPDVYTIQTTGRYQTLDGKQVFRYQAGQKIPMELAIAMGLQGAGWPAGHPYELSDAAQLESQAVEPLVYQDFRDASNGQPPVTDSRHPWQYTYGSGSTASILEVIDGFLTNDVVAGATAGYAEVNLGAPVKRIGGTVTFGPSSAVGGTAGIVIWRTEHISGQVPESPLHLTFSPERVQVDIIEGVVFTSLGATWFQPTLKQDGVTEYTVEAEIIGDTAYISVSNGETLVVTDPRVASFAGSWACWEVFASNAATQTKVRFAETWADTKARRVRAQSPSRFPAAQMVDASRYPVIAKQYFPNPAANFTVTTTATKISDDLTLTYVVPPSGKVLLECTAYVVNPASTTLLLGFSDVLMVVATGVFEGPVTVRYIQASTPGTVLTKEIRARHVGGTDATIRASSPGGYAVVSSVTPLPS